MYEIIILTLTRSQMYEFITQTCDRTGLWLTIQIGMYNVLASFNIFMIVITESYYLYYMCTRRSNVIIDGIYFWRTSSKNCFTRCSGSWPGFFSLGWAGIASLLKHSGWLSLVIPGYSNSVESIVDVSKFYLSLSLVTDANCQLFQGKTTLNFTSFIGQGECSDFQARTRMGRVD